MTASAICFVVSLGLSIYTSWTDRLAGVVETLPDIIVIALELSLSMDYWRRYFELQSECSPTDDVISSNMRGEVAQKPIQSSKVQSQKALWDYPNQLKATKINVNTNLAMPASGSEEFKSTFQLVTQELPGKSCTALPCQPNARVQH